MKLSEALIKRKDLVEQIGDLSSRIAQNTSKYEGETPSENPVELLELQGRVVEELGYLIVRINKTNNLATLESGETISEAIVNRDMLKMRQEHLQAALTYSNPQNFRRNRHYSSSVEEPKTVPTMDASDLRKQLDGFSKAFRELDNAIQAANWANDLID